MGVREIEKGRKDGRSVIQSSETTGVTKSENGRCGIRKGRKGGV